MFGTDGSSNKLAYVHLATQESHTDTDIENTDKDNNSLGQNIQLIEFNSPVSNHLSLYDEEDIEIKKYILRQETESRLHLTLIKRNAFIDKLLAWLSMVLAILSGSSIGPMFKYMQKGGISPCLAASWRCQCMFIFLAPLAILERLRNDNAKVNFLAKKPDLTFPVFGHVIIAGMVWAGNLLFWVWGLHYTSTVRASLFSQMHPFLLVFVLHFTSGGVSLLEWIGVIVSIVGVVVAGFDGIKDMFTSRGGSALMLYGDFLCLLAAACEVCVMLNRLKIKKYVPLMQYTAITTFMVATLASAVALLFEDSMGHVFCMQENCIFGWVSDEWSLKILFFGLVIGVVCISGFNYAMQYIPPLVFSGLSLLDTPVTGIISWVAGLEGIPDMKTWISASVMISGVGVIILGEHYRNSGSHGRPSHSTDDTTCASSSSSSNSSDSTDASKVGAGLGELALHDDETHNILMTSELTVSD